MKAILLTLGLVVAASGASTASAAAHPAGYGTSIQGRSPSDPDGLSNGGADKPGGSGGVDADKDGNNGCGNDTDFEDDNNGNCGGLHRGSAQAVQAQAHGHAHVAAAQATRTVQGTEAAANSSARVLGVSSVRNEETPTTADNTAVLGTSFVRGAGVAAPAAALATTGAMVWAMVLLGLACIAVGTMLVRTP